MSAAPRRLVALVDGSAFYVSCERVFDPRLDGVPVAVLSNNDGCVIARSDEVRAVGIKMGEPFFKARERLEAIGARVLSSNYTFYGDMSRRVMETLEVCAAEVSGSAAVYPYSIDEAFVSVPCPAGPPEAVREAAEAWAAEVRARVLCWTGIPVRVSVAETKTLAKAASELARAEACAGAAPVVCLVGHPRREAWLAALPVESVWGVGRRWGVRLRALRVENAAAFAHLPDVDIRRALGVVGLRTAYELRGVPAVRLGDAPARHTLIRSRSFGERITDRQTLTQAIATHTARACEKLRREGLVAAHVAAFVTTKGYGAGPHRSAWEGVALDAPTAHTPTMLRAALLALARGYAAADPSGQPYGYRKAGVVLSGIVPAGAAQTSLFARAPDDPRAARLMAAVDAANRRFGRRAVVFAAMGAPQTLARARDGTDAAPRWEMRRQHMTPRYTTHWNELATAVA